MKRIEQTAKFPPLPETFLERMRELLGSESNQFIDSLNKPSSSGLRINTNKVKVEKLLSHFPLDMTPVPWCPTGYQFASVAGETTDFSPGKHPYHAAGLYYLQEPSAMAVVEILDPQPREHVLDLAAAPGGKATHIVSKMDNSGMLVANDIHPQRVWELAENLERWGARNAVVLNESPERLVEHFPQYFDRVLVDTPCSGEGMFRKSDNSRREWSPGVVQSCAVRQSAILEQACRMVRPGGSIVYSTCTFAPEENEAVIAGFLRQHAQFEVSAAADAHLIFSPGHAEWAGQVSAGIAAQVEKIARIWPHRHPGDGHTIARLQHKWNAPRVDDPIHKPASLPASYRRAFDEFCRASLKQGWQSERFMVKGTYLYQPPELLPDLNGLHNIHPGLWLGAFKRGAHAGEVRFEPAHAMAMAIQPAQANQTSPLDYEQAVRYLKGEAFSLPGEDGWVLVTFDGYALGWGKRSRGVVKNTYPKGLRWV